MEALKWILTLLWPPLHNDPHLNRWQRHMAASMIIVATSIVALSLAATGRLESVGIDGFASSKEVAEVKKSTQNIEARIILQDIYETRKEQCRAKEDDNAPATKPAIMRRLDNLMSDYKRLKGQEYTLPSCDEI